MSKHKHHGPTKDKAKEMLSHGTVHGKRLTAKQKRFLGFIAGGGKPTKMKH